MDEIIKNQI